MKAAQEQERLMKEQALMDDMKADELLERNEINNELIRKDTEKFMGEQSAALAGKGQSLSGVTAMGLLEDTYRSMLEDIARNNRDAEWEAGMIRLGASSTRDAAKRTKKAAWIGALGTGLSGAGTAAKEYSPKDKEPKKKPEVE